MPNWVFRDKVQEAQKGWQSRERQANLGGGKTLQGSHGSRELALVRQWRSS